MDKLIEILERWMIRYIIVTGIFIVLINVIRSAN